MNKATLITLSAIALVLLASACNTTQPTPTATEVAVLLSPSSSATAVLLTAATPTLAPTATATRPPASTATLAPSPEPGPTAAPSQTSPPPSPMPSPTGQGQPASTATPSPPAILYFRANTQIADPGDTIIIEWDTLGAASVTLWRLMPTGQFGRFWDVAGSGSFDYDIDPAERNQTRFVLTVVDDQGQTQSATLSVALRCTADWFFNNHPAICPVQAALYSPGAEQPFEHGIMVWVEDEDRIYVLFDDGNSPRWKAFQDHWQPGDPVDDPTLTPPAGLYQPVRGFGLLWRQEPGVRDRLGWATAAETGFSATVQRTSYAKYNETYLRALDGDIWRLEPEQSAWSKIPPG